MFIYRSEHSFSSLNGCVTSCIQWHPLRQTTDVFVTLFCNFFLFSPCKFSHVNLHELIFFPLFSMNSYLYTLNSLRTRICWIFIHSGWKAVSWTVAQKSIEGSSEPRTITNHFYLFLFIQTSYSSQKNSSSIHVVPFSHYLQKASKSNIYSLMDKCFYYIPKWI